METKQEFYRHNEEEFIEFIKTQRLGINTAIIYELTTVAKDNNISLYDAFCSVTRFDFRSGTYEAIQELLSTINEMDN